MQCYQCHSGWQQSCPRQRAMDLGYCTKLPGHHKSCPLQHNSDQYGSRCVRIQMDRDQRWLYPCGKHGNHYQLCNSDCSYSRFKPEPMRHPYFSIPGRQYANRRYWFVEYRKRWFRFFQRQFERQFNLHCRSIRNLCA